MLTQFVCWITSIMWCIQTTQIIHSDLFISSVLTFSANSAEYRKISQNASYRNVSWNNCIVTHVSCCVLYLKVLVSTRLYGLGASQTQLPPPRSLSLVFYSESSIRATKNKPTHKCQMLWTKLQAWLFSTTLQKMLSNCNICSSQFSRHLFTHHDI